MEEQAKFKARKLGTDEEWDKLTQVKLFVPKRVLRNLMGIAHEGNTMGLILEILTDVSNQIEEDNNG